MGAPPLDLLLFVSWSATPYSLDLLTFWTQGSFDSVVWHRPYGHDDLDTVSTDGGELFTAPFLVILAHPESSLTLSIKVRCERRRDAHYSDIHFFIPTSSYSWKRA